MVLRRDDGFYDVDDVPRPRYMCVNAVEYIRFSGRWWQNSVVGG